MTLKNIAVVGAGTMGHSIALSFALNKLNVNIIDKDKIVLKKSKDKIEEEISLMIEVGYINENSKNSIRERVHYYSDMKEALNDRDYVIEAVSENLELKQKIFLEMNRYSPNKAILATNTSSLKLMDIIKDIPKDRHQNCIISHWFNPAHIMPIVELSFFGNTTDEVYSKVESLYTSMNKKIIKVYKDIPGLVATRLQQSLAREVYHLLEEKVVNEQDVDKAVKYGPSFRHVTSGLLEVCDMGGIDIWSTVADNLFPDLSKSAESNEVLSSKLEAGDFGIKTGRGFYNYTNNPEKIKNDFNRKLLKQLKFTEQL